MNQFHPVGSKDITRLSDLAHIELTEILETAADFKRHPQHATGALSGRSIAMLFEKPSLRTRMSFEVGAFRMGAQAIYLDHTDTPLGVRETLSDYGHNLERWCHAIVARVKSHQTIDGLANSTRIPIINALCDQHHPCQALADLQTLLERGFNLNHSRLAWIGDGNNVCHSLIEAASILGFGITVVTPKGFEPDPTIVSQCVARSMRSGARIDITNEISAIQGAFAVYTDTWISMGQEDSAAKKAAFEPYQVDCELMSIAGPNALFMHCLPAHRGEEVTDEVIDSHNSVVFDQAENRMHAQNALLCHLLAPKAVTIPAHHR